MDVRMEKVVSRHHTQLAGMEQRINVIRIIAMICSTARGDCRANVISETSLEG
jgi:hypothetical protein